MAIPMPTESTVHCIADVHAVLGEGPVWVASEQALYWVDIKGRKIFRLGEDGELSQWPTPFRVGSIAPRVSGGFIAGTDEGIAQLDLKSGKLDLLLNPEEALPGNRFNDGKADREGRFWAGTMDDSERRPTGSLYRVDVDRSVTTIDSGYRVTNGPAFGPDGRTMYESDSSRQLTYAFDLDEAGNATGRRNFIQFGKGDGYPDGMTVDAEGCLWIAFWDGWCVRRFSPSGDLLLKLDTPVQRPTSVAFGGEGLQTLFITSASRDLQGTDLDRQPLAGGLFAVRVGVSGIAERPFRG